MKATLAGVPLENLEDVSWRFTHGVEPYQRAFEVRRSGAQAILEASKDGKEVELVVDDGRSKSLRVKALSILTVGPGTHPDRLRVLVADRRTWWRGRIVKGNYNVKRRSGEFSLVDGALQRLDPVPDLDFCPYSLRNEKTEWSAREVVEDALKQVTQGLYDMSGGDFSNAPPIEGLVLDGEGATQLEAAISEVPNLAVWMDAEGIAQLTSEASGAEEAELAAAGPALTLGQSLWVATDLARLRPRAIECYLSPEDEVRFDFVEGITHTNVVREPRELENVMPLPDKKLTINGKVVVRNTWVVINQALLDAWNGDTANPPVVTIGTRTVRLPPITFAIIQKLFLSKGGYHAYFEIGADSGNPVWARRWSALYQHYRQTFRLPRRWVDRIYEFSLARVAIAHAETRTRAPADVYADHAKIPSAQRIAYFRADTSKKLAVNVKAWADLGAAKPALTDAVLAETAVLLPQDPEQGVFRLAFKPDSSGDTVAVIPSVISSRADGDSNEIPEADPRAILAAFFLHKAILSSRHRVSVVITLAPASPVGLGGLHKIVVKPEDARGLLPAKIAARVKTCTGPVMQVRVSPRVATARFAWQDTAASEVESSILDGLPRSEARLLDPKHVRNVCSAISATIYARFADRPEGAHVTRLDADRRPVGRISQVVHGLTPKGVAFTRLDMPPDLAEADFYALLPEDTRRQLFGRVTRSL